MDSLPLPEFVRWPIFPFEGDMRVKPYKTLYPSDRPRLGETGGAPCPLCEASDDKYLWVDEHWRVSAPTQPEGIPVSVTLEPREHLDLEALDEEQAAGLGRMIVRINRAVRAVEGVGRVHIGRWGDGVAHLHVGFFARPLGSSQMLGWALPMWSLIVPPTHDDQWRRNLDVVANELAKQGGVQPRST
jgi:hypothetical protein